MDLHGRFAELIVQFKRRRVFRTAGLYLAGAFILLQVADLVLQAAFFPEWTYSAVVLVAGLGFPVALVLAWAFDWTPDGLRRTDAAVPGRTGTRLESTPVLGRWSLAVVVVLATALAGMAVWRGLVTPASPPPALATAPPIGGDPLDPLRVAVLYLENQTADDSLDYLARGLTDGLITALGHVDTLRVASRNAVLAAREGTVSVDQLVTELGAGTYVEGSLSRAGDELRVALQLVDAATGFTLSTHSVSRPGGQVLALRDTLVTELSEALRRRLGIEVRARDLRAGGRNDRSWTLVHRADRIRDGIAQLWSREPAAVPLALDRADSLLAQAEAADPAWAEPALKRAWTGYSRASYSAELPGGLAVEPLTQALPHAERALRLAGHERPAALEARGILRFGLADNVEGAAERSRWLRLARADLSSAIAEDPRLARSWWFLSEIHRLDGDDDASLRAAERALAEDAFLEEAPLIYRQLFYTAFEREEHERAAHWCGEGRRRFPAQADLILCRLLLLATVDTIPPDPVAAGALADTLIAATPASDSVAWRSYAHMQLAKLFARAGRPDSAEALIRRAHGNGFQPWLGYDEAHARILLGDRDSALVLLQGYLEVSPDRAPYWPDDWWLRELWTVPGFQDLVRSATDR